MLSDSVISDPFSEYSSISILSRAFKASGIDTTSTCGDDIDFIHSHVNSLELESPQKLSEQAKTVVADGMEFSVMNIQYNIRSQKVKENHNEERLDLGRKRARFSLNPNLGKPTLNLETNFNIDQLQDPDEYFMAYEKLENARKELKRQGVDIPVNNIDSSRQKMPSKQSRPGMFRKPVTYTHRYLPMVSDMEETDLHTTDPSSHKYEPEIVVQSATGNEIGSHEVLLTNIKNEESSDILKELMSSKIEDLDGDEAVSFVEEYLNLKPINVEKLQISDLPEARRSSFMFSESKMMKLGTDFSGVKNMMRTHNNEISKQEVQDTEIFINPSASPSPVKSPSEILHGLEDHLIQPNTNSNNIEKSFPRVAKRSVNKTEPHDTKMDSLDYKSPETRVSEKFRRSLASPLPHKSPLAAMQSLKKQLMQSITRAYSFSNMDPDTSPEKNDETVVKSSEITYGDTETNQKDHMSFGTQTTHPSRHLFRSPSPSHHQTPLDSVGAQRFLNSDLFLDRNSTVDVTDGDKIEQPATGTGLTDSENIVINTEHDASSTYVNSFEFLNENSLEQYDLKKPKETDLVLSPEDDVSKSNRINLEDGIDEELDNHILDTNSLTNSDKVGSGDADKVSETSVEDGAFPSENDAGKIEVNGDACTTGELRSDNHVSAVTVVNNKRGQQKLRREKRKKETLKRHSLADVGTTWETGVRRGTRIRMRPLEYWKGERFLYGRVHESLVTVIGVKYMSSPSTKGDTKPMKVQSYVSDHFKGLVEQAALH